MYITSCRKKNNTATENQKQFKVCSRLCKHIANTQYPNVGKISEYLTNILWSRTFYRSEDLQFRFKGKFFEAYFVDLHRTLVQLFEHMYMAPLLVL